MDCCPSKSNTAHSAPRPLPRDFIFVYCLSSFKIELFLSVHICLLLMYGDITRVAQLRSTQEICDRSHSSSIANLQIISLKGWAERTRYHPTAKSRIQRDQNWNQSHWSHQHWFDRESPVAGVMSTRAILGPRKQLSALGEYIMKAIISQVKALQPPFLSGSLDI